MMVAMDDFDHRSHKSEQAVKLDEMEIKVRNGLEVLITALWYKKMHPNETVNFDVDDKSSNQKERNTRQNAIFLEWTGKDINDPNSPAAKFSNYLTSGKYRTLEACKNDSIDLNDKDAVLELFNSMFADTIFPPNQADRHNQ